MAWTATPEILSRFDQLIEERQRGAKELGDFKVAARLAAEKAVPVSRLQQLLDYDPDTGVLQWKASASLMQASKAGSLRGLHKRDPNRSAKPAQTGYLTIGIDGFRFGQHRVAWAIHTGSWPSDQIDHENRDRTCNKISNLKEATNAENHENRSDNQSGAVGVLFEKSRQKWKAYIRVGYVMHNVGRFETFEDAKLARAVYKERLKCLGY